MAQLITLPVIPNGSRKGDLIVSNHTEHGLIEGETYIIVDPFAKQVAQVGTHISKLSDLELDISTVTVYYTSQDWFISNFDYYEAEEIPEDPNTQVELAPNEVEITFESIDEFIQNLIDGGMLEPGEEQYIKYYSFEELYGYDSTQAEFGSIGKKRGMSSVLGLYKASGVGSYSLGISPEINLKHTIFVLSRDTDNDAITLGIGDKEYILIKSTLINFMVDYYGGSVFLCEISEAEYNSLPIEGKHIFTIDPYEINANDFSQNVNITVGEKQYGQLTDYKGYSAGIGKTPAYTQDGEYRLFEFFGAIDYADNKRVPGGLPTIIADMHDVIFSNSPGRELTYNSPMALFLLENGINFDVKLTIDGIEYVSDDYASSFPHNNETYTWNLSSKVEAFSSHNTGTIVPVSIEYVFDFATEFGTPTIELDTNGITVKKISGRYGWVNYNSQWYYVVKNSSQLKQIAKKFNNGTPGYEAEITLDDETHTIPINRVVVSNIKRFNNIFTGLSNFNQDISSWDVSNGISFDGMFEDASSFNQDISIWDVSNARDMNGMFYYASAFDQDLSNWTPDTSYPGWRFDYSSGFEDVTAKHPTWK